MKLGELLHQVLCERYLCKTINSSFGDTFVVGEIVVDQGSYGDPPIEISFRSREYVDAAKEYGEWSRINNPSGGVSAPKEIEVRFREACLNGSCCLMDFNEDLPEIL